MDRAAMIDFLVSHGGAAELHDLLRGVSVHNAGGDGSDVADSSSLLAIKLVSAAKAHLSFVSKYGPEETHVIEGDAHYFPFPGKFAEWVGDGAPGISSEELRNLFDDFVARHKSSI